jgi:hypothetical protein
VLVSGCDSEDKLRALSDPEAAENALKRTRELWRSRVCRALDRHSRRGVKSHDKRWAPYQALSCRIMGRTSIYQQRGCDRVPRPAPVHQTSLCLCPGQRGSIFWMLRAPVRGEGMSTLVHPGFGMSKGCGQGARTTCSGCPGLFASIRKGRTTCQNCEQAAPYLLAPELAGTRAADMRSPAGPPLRAACGARREGHGARYPAAARESTGSC